jgi:hypothetical protein
MFRRRSKKIWIKAILSVMASFLGVQSNENRAHDFEQGRFPIFVVSGLFMTLILLVGVYGLVQLVMMYVE